MSKELTGRGNHTARFDPLGLALASFGLTLAILGAIAAVFVRNPQGQTGEDSKAMMEQKAR